MARQRPARSAVQAKLAAARLKPVPLRVVASLLHHQLGGRGRSAMLGPQYIEKLNSAAARLSRLVDIYVVDGQGETTLLPRPALVGAEFLDGGNVLRTAAGTNHHPLVVRRAEALAAIGAVANETAES